MTEGFLLDAGTPDARRLGEEEVGLVLESIAEEIGKEGTVTYSHTYAAGDLIISDNLAVSHTNRICQSCKSYLSVVQIVCTTSTTRLGTRRTRRPSCPRRRSGSG
jgi:hypothetical protein